MKNHSTPELLAAQALVRLLAARPALRELVWKVGEQPGVLTGEQHALSGRGEIVDVAAEVMGGTVAHSTAARGEDRQGAAQLVATYAGVQVHVWASYPLPGPDGLTSADVHRMLAARPMGALPVRMGGAL